MLFSWTLISRFLIGDIGEDSSASSMMIWTLFSLTSLGSKLSWIYLVSLNSSCCNSIFFLSRLTIDIKLLKLSELNDLRDTDHRLCCPTLWLEFSTFRRAELLSSFTFFSLCLRNLLWTDDPLSPLVDFFFFIIGFS